MLIDARSVSDGAEFSCDVCIVGAGPAGITLANRFRQASIDTILLESGGFDPELPSQRLSRGQRNNGRYFQLDACRPRVFGGSTNAWGGWCRPLEPVDFERFSWLPHSGWPITAESLSRYYAEVAELVELSDARFDLERWRDILPPPFPIDGTNFENAIFRFSPPTNFGRAYRDALVRAQNVRLFLYANLMNVTREAGSRAVTRLAVGTLSGRRFTIRPTFVVLACGGIENARLLLASRDHDGIALGNEHGLVGRFFMEHVHAPVGHMVATPRAADRRFYRQTTYGEEKIRGVIAPTEEARRTHQLLGTSIAVEAPSYSVTVPLHTWPPAMTVGPARVYRKLIEGPAHSVAESLRRNVERASTLPFRTRTWLASRDARTRGHLYNGAGGRRVYSLYFRSEQAPNPASRVELSDRRDALGVPEARLDWRLSDVDTAAITGWLEILNRDLQRSDLGSVIAPPDDWQRDIVGGPHHMGTTRMSASPRDGVVDADCRVHTVDNVYVAGSSVFATGGFANPTFTIVALALRLADTLTAKLSEHR